MNPSNFPVLQKATQELLITLVQAQPCVESSPNRKNTTAPPLTLPEKRKRHFFPPAKVIFQVDTPESFASIRMQWHSSQRNNIFWRKGLRQNQMLRIYFGNAHERFELFVKKTADNSSYINPRYFSSSLRRVWICHNES